MSTTDKVMDCACACGSASYTATGTPLFRLVCHCSICQRFNDAPFADVLVFRGRDVGAPAPQSVHYARWRPPPNVRRGSCVRCGAPAIELFHAPLLPKLTMVPAQNVDRAEALPDPVAHIFYESRIAEAADSLPKYEGYWRSQLLFARLLAKALLRR